MSRVPTMIASGLAALWALPALAVPEQAFQVRTTAQLVELCSAQPSDPSYPQAQQFCNGFAAGALSYDRGMARPGSTPRYCNLPPTRAEAVNRFVSWANTHPQFMGDNPANTLFRFLDANYRCRR